MLDYNRSNTIEDILRRYDLEGLKRDRNRVYQIQGELTNTEGILNDFVDATTQDIDIINDQLDGNVTSWFYGYVPTLSNVPASNWTTDDEKSEHLSDLFYNTDNGKVYKFTKGLTSGNVYDSSSAPELSTSERNGVSIDVTNSRIGTTTINPFYKITYIECTPNTKYNIKKSLGSYFKLATSTNLTYVNYYIPCNQAFDLDNETEYEITTGANDNYLLIGYQVVSGQTMNDIRNSIEIYSEYETEQFMWLEVTNIVGAQTLAVANAAQDTLDHNRRVFVVQPTPPYDVGDVWNNNNNHKLYRCRVSKTSSQSFDSADWIDSLKYVDNSYAIAVENEMITSYATKSELTTTENSINASVKALKVTTDAKHSIYQSPPNPPYYVGDIYISSGNVYNCIQDRTTGSFTQSDWEIDLELTEYVSQAGIDIFQDSINMEVKQKVGDDEIISKINQSAEAIEIDANKINLNGYISANGQFIIDTNSSLTLIGGANTAKFTIKQDTDNTKEVYLTPNALYMAAPSSGTTTRIVNGAVPNIMLSNTNTGKSSGMGVGSIDCSDSVNKLYAHLDCTELNFESGTNRTRTLTMDVDTGTIETIGLIQSQNGICQGSLEEIKENFEPLKSGLEILKDIDIYKYNYKDENVAKKHIGLVIGDNYNYSKEVTNDKNDAVDLYSFVSVCCKAIQEQQKEIEELKKRLEELENGKIR